MSLKSSKKTFGLQFKAILKTMFPRIACAKRFSFAKAHVSDIVYYREKILQMAEQNGVEVRQLRIAFNLTIKKTSSQPQYILA
jgi:hypothetical protein